MTKVNTCANAKLNTKIIWAAIPLQLLIGEALLLHGRDLTQDSLTRSSGKLLVMLALMQLAPAFVWTVVQDQELLKSLLPWLLPAPQLMCCCFRGCFGLESKRKPTYISKWKFEPLLGTSASTSASAPTHPSPPPPAALAGAGDELDAAKSAEGMEEQFLKIDSEWWKCWWVQFVAISAWVVFVLWKLARRDLWHILQELANLGHALGENSNSEEFKHTVFILAYMHVVLSGAALWAHLTMALARSRLELGIKLYRRDLWVWVSFAILQVTFLSPGFMLLPLPLALFRAIVVLMAVPSHVITTLVLSDELTKLCRHLQEKMAAANSLQDLGDKLDSIAEEHAEVSWSWLWFVHFHAWLELAAFAFRTVVIVIFLFRNLRQVWGSRCPEDKRDLLVFVTSIPTFQPFLLVQFFSVGPYNDKIQSMAEKVFDPEIKYRVERLSFRIFGIQLTTAKVWSLCAVVFTLGEKPVLEYILHTMFGKTW